MTTEDPGKLQLILRIAGDVAEAVEHLDSMEGVADDIKAAVLRVVAETYGQKMTQEFTLAILKASITKAGL